MDRKFKIYTLLREVIQSKISDAETVVGDLKKSKADSTKSSAGDKHETERAMIQLEMDKSLAQLDLAHQQLKVLLSINIHQNSEKVGHGSLVITNLESYFISIGTGKLVVDDEIVYAISPHSPLGVHLVAKKVNDKFNFQNREYLIKDIF